MSPALSMVAVGDHHSNCHGRLGDGMARRSRTRIGEGPISLYTGGIELDGSSTGRHRGRIRLVWEPEPRIEFEVTGPVGLARQVDEARSEDDGFGLITDVGHVRGDAYMWDYFGNRERISGAVRPVTIGAAETTDWLLARIVNLPISNGPPTLVLEAEGWNLVLEDLNVDRFDSPRDPRTYVVTHNLRLYRNGYAAFPAADGVELLRAFNYYASLCRGAWSSFILPVGRGPRGRVMWRHWEVGRIDTSGIGSGWAIQRNDGPDPFIEMWPGFLAKWRQATWQRTLRTLIELSIEAAAHTKGEASLMIDEVVLELLSWAVVVGDRQMLTPEGHDRLGASDRLRLLLSLVQLPRHIPDDFVALSTLAAREKWIDGPHAVAELRNRIAHPNKRQRTGGVTDEAIWQADGLSRTYFAEVVYWLFTGRALPAERYSTADLREIGEE